MTTPYTTLARATRAKSSVTFDHLLSASEHIDGAVGWKSLLRTYRGIEVFLRSDLPYLAIGPVNQLESIVTVEGETIEGSVSPSGDSIVLVDAPAGVTQATVTGDIGLGTLVPAGVLVGAIDAFTRDVDVDAVRPGNSFRIDREMLVRNNEHETIRGAGGTVAAPHADGADVWIVGAPRTASEPGSNRFGESGRCRVSAGPRLRADHHQGNQGRPAAGLRASGSASAGRACYRHGHPHRCG